MIKKIIINIIFILTPAMSYSALTITGTAPQYQSGANSVAANIILESTFQTALIRLNTDLRRINSQEKLAGAFGDACSYSSHAGSMWSYQGYEDFAFYVTWANLSVKPFMTSTDTSEIEKELEANGDTDSGISISNAFNIGMNMQSFGYDSLYLNLKYGQWILNDANFNGKSTLFGIGINYQLKERYSDKTGFILWRGFSFGSGINYHKNSIDINNIDFGTRTYQLTGLPFSNNNLYIESQIDISTQSYSLTVPLEASTSLRLAWFLNLSTGIGFDLNYGKSKVSPSYSGVVRITGTEPPGCDDLKPGSVTVTGGTESYPFFVNPRLMAGIGLTAGPAVIINLDTAYYLPLRGNDGMSLSLSSGFFW